jgi:hypothetical protein
MYVVRIVRDAIPGSLHRPLPDARIRQAIEDQGTARNHDSRDQNQADAMNHHPDCHQTSLISFSLSLNTPLANK